MMVVQAEQDRVKALLIEAVTCVCENVLSFNRKMCVQGLLGITLDEKDVFLIDMKEMVNKLAISREQEQNKHSNGAARQESSRRFSSSQKTYSSPVKRAQPSQDSGPDPKRQSLEEIPAALKQIQVTTKQEVVHVEEMGKGETGDIVKERDKAANNNGEPVDNLPSENQVVLVQSDGCVEVITQEQYASQQASTSQAIMDDAFGFGQMDDSEINPEDKEELIGSSLPAPEAMHIVPISPLNRRQVPQHSRAPDVQHGRGTHVETEETKKTYCYECHVTFGSRQELDEHVVERHLPEWHQCSRCKRVFVRLANLKRHMQLCFME